MKNIIPSFTPTIKNLDFIRNWLYQEHIEHNAGFYYNWNVIESAYNQDKMIVLMDGHKTIGFLVWAEFEKIVVLNIAEVDRRYRENGYCRLMLRALGDYCIKCGLIVIKLNCRPSSSEVVWRRLGFVDYPEVTGFNSYNQDEDRYLFKVLQECSLTSTIEPNEEVIELWDNEPAYCRAILPNWTWNISCKPKTNELLAPIIHPAFADWRISWRKGDEVLYDGKVKRFPVDISFSEFIIITEIPEVISR